MTRLARAESFEHLNGAHIGETIFVLGAGPQLGRLTAAERHALEQQVCIGVNKTCYVVRPTYFLSAYVGEVILAAHRCPETTVIHMRPVYEPALVQGALPLKRAVFTPDVRLPDRLEPPEPTLYTKLNVALGATHLALVLGADRLVYVGVEQRSQAHFYHYDETARAEILADLPILAEVPFLTVDHEYSTYERQLEKLNRPLADCQGDFYSVDHSPTFAGYFDQLRARGIEIYTTLADSVVADAGADVQPLERFLTG